MIAAGVEPGDRVAIWAPNGAGWIVAALGAHSAGAAIVPVNTRWKGAEAAYVLAASKAVVLVTTAGFLGADTVGMLRDAGTPLPHLRRIVLLDGDADAAKGPDGTVVEPCHAFASRGDEVAGGRGGGAPRRRAADGPERRALHVGHDRAPQGRGHDARPDGVAVPRVVCVRRAAGRRPLPHRQPVLPHVRVQGGLAREPAAGRDDLPGAGVRRRARAVARAERADHRAARRADRLPHDPRPSRSREVRSLARCASRSPARPTSPSR